MFTLIAPNKNCSRRHFNFLLLSFEEIRLDFSCESSAKQRIHLKHQVLFSLKNNEKIFINVVCCSSDWRFKVNYLYTAFKGRKTNSISIKNQVQITYLTSVLSWPQINTGGTRTTIIGPRCTKVSRVTPSGRGP